MIDNCNVCVHIVQFWCVIKKKKKFTHTLYSSNGKKSFRRKHTLNLPCLTKLHCCDALAKDRRRA